MIYQRYTEALRILYEKYLEFRGHDLRHITKQYKILIENSLSRPKRGLLNKRNSDFLILLPKNPCSLEMEQIIGFHELAHVFIHDIEQPYRYIIKPPSPAEAWCDNFSLAMTLELYKQKPVGIDDYETFFRQGEGLERLRVSDPFLGRKILSYFIDERQLNFPFLNEPVVNLAPGCHPLIDLGRELLITDD